MKSIRSALWAPILALTCMFAAGLADPAEAQTKKPNIVI